MKKFFRFVVFIFKLSILPFTAWIINSLIFRRSSSRRKSMFTEYFYEWRHGDIRYTVTGQGRPLLLLHRPGGYLAEWDKVVPALSRHYKVYTLDLIGFGYSDKPNLKYSSYLYVTMINDFVRDVIGRGTAVVGSGLAADFAVMAYHFEPEFYNKLILISPTGTGSHVRIAQKNDLWLKWLLETPLLGTSIFNIMYSRIGWMWRRSGIELDMIGKYYRASHYGGPKVRIPMTHLITNFLNVDIRSKLAKVKIPIHIIWGENEQGVMPHIKSPDSFCSECLRFLKEQN